MQGIKTYTHKVTYGGSTYVGVLIESDGICNETVSLEGMELSPDYIVHEAEFPIHYLGRGNEREYLKVMLDSIAERDNRKRQNIHK